MQGLSTHIKYIAIVMLIVECWCGTCNYKNCPYLQGICSNNECICAGHYVTVDKNTTDIVYCNHKTKSKFTAFVFEFFLPFGMGHFYADNFGKGIIKMALFIGIVVGCCCELCCIRSVINKGIVWGTFVLLTIFLVWLTFQVIDLGGYLFGYYYDGFGIPLY